MQYIEVQYGDGTTGYQEVFQGQVQRYTDMQGTTIGNQLPAGGTCTVLNAQPVPPVWALPDPVVPVVVQHKLLTPLQFLALFTEQELETIWSASKTVVPVGIWVMKFQLATTIDLADPDTITGLDALEAGGLIGVGRAQAILNA